MKNINISSNPYFKDYDKLVDIIYLISSFDELTKIFGRPYLPNHEIHPYRKSIWKFKLNDVEFIIFDSYKTIRERKKALNPTASTEYIVQSNNLNNLIILLDYIVNVNNLTKIKLRRPYNVSAYQFAQKIYSLPILYFIKNNETNHDENKELNIGERSIFKEILKKFCDECHDVAVSKGFYGENHSKPITDMLLLIHSEVSEACDAYRNYNDEEFKKELADIAIRLFDLASYLKIDLGSEILNKFDYNKTRPYMHGNKKI